MRRPRVVFVRAAPSAATRRAVFADDEPLDARGREQAAALRLPEAPALAGPERAAVETADLAGFAATAEPRLADASDPAWSGRRIDELDPDAIERWLADVGTRVRAVLDECRERDATVCFSAGAPIRAAVIAALDAPADAFWRLDVAPCSVTELHARPDGGWTVVKVNA